ncbi:molybdenum cofactor guanylyltransferase MobA [Maritimibacter alexandrii]|uniref:molybdenum cofactor guanylyltransferase MobA n=1 Tax=Maritimibacter alexandrii TaxID=2570355 RepID=UPI0011081BF6|nr:molybdenum cofactor guanylyltransferase MobA [Maritimibacter alexandrii]
MSGDTQIPPGVILAGGQARRMGGRDKAFVTLDGRPMIAHVIARLEPQVSRIAINSNGDPSAFTSSHPILSDSIEDHLGPLAGILAAMDWALTLKSDWVVTVATDTPFIPANLVDRLIRAQNASRAPIVLAETPAGVEPVAGLWYTKLANGLRGSIQTGTRKVTDFTEEKDAVSAFFAAEDFFNVNTPEDLDMAEARLRAQR